MDKIVAPGSQKLSNARRGVFLLVKLKKFIGPEEGHEKRI